MSLGADGAQVPGQHFLNDNPSAAIGIIRRVRQMCQRCPKDTATLAKLEAQFDQEDKG